MEDRGVGGLGMRLAEVVCKEHISPNKFKTGSGTWLNMSVSVSN